MPTKEELITKKANIEQLKTYVYMHYKKEDRPSGVAKKEDWVDEVLKVASVGIDC